MSKFFIPRENVSENEIVVTGEDVVHISKVLRLRTGDGIVCCDGRGYDYISEITETDKNRIVCKIIKKIKSDTEPPIKVTLIQGIPKASKMDYIIQKTTELGISEIYPCDMNRCVSKTEGNKKTERWQKIAKEAAQQSGRGIIPEVNKAVTVKDAVEILKKSDIAFVAYECEDKGTLRDVLKNSEEPKTVAFMIGPEGGFDKSEIGMLRESGIPVISLGKRILRTETAGEAVLSMIMYEIGDINTL